jgi:trimethylamine--corrinoid protein Co-methyltransferase
LIDVEIFRMGKRAYQGVTTGADRWLGDVIDGVGPSGHFLAEKSTVDALRDGEWYVSDFGVHHSFEDWEAAGRPTLLEEARGKVDHILATHEPLPLDDEVERELERIVERARAEE